MSHTHRAQLEHCKSNSCTQVLRHKIQKFFCGTTACKKFLGKGNPPPTSTEAATGYTEIKYQLRIQVLTKPTLFLYAFTASFKKGQPHILSFLNPQRENWWQLMKCWVPRSRIMQWEPMCFKCISPFNLHNHLWVTCSWFHFAGEKTES